MKLTIITINYNNAAGLKKTMESVLSQTSNDFEYIIIDGGSVDGGKELIEQLAISDKRLSYWVSEPDSGIYNAMNKGIKMAKGEYVQFVNSGDCLIAPVVTERMLTCLIARAEVPQILYGNMLKQLSNRMFIDKGFQGRQPTLLDFYVATLNHSSAYISRDLFDKYGLYDESLKIVSDWKWYLEAIILGSVKPLYVDIDVTVFDMNGISSVNLELDKKERTEVLEKHFSQAILSDYKQWALPIDGMKRINRYWLTRKSFFLIERILFKWEKWTVGKKA